MTRDVPAVLGNRVRAGILATEILHEFRHVAPMRLRTLTRKWMATKPTHWRETFYWINGRWCHSNELAYLELTIKDLKEKFGIIVSVDSKLLDTKKRTVNFFSGAEFVRWLGNQAGYACSDCGKARAVDPTFYSTQYRGGELRQAGPCKACLEWKRRGSVVWTSDLPKLLRRVKKTVRQASCDGRVR